jgi:nitrate/nitrite transporter NarK
MKLRAALPQSGYRTMFALAFAIAFLVHLLLFCLSPMVEILMAEMQLSHAQFGFVFSAAMISLILFRLPSARLRRRTSPREKSMYSGSWGTETRTR